MSNTLNTVATPTVAPPAAPAEVPLPQALYVNRVVELYLEYPDLVTEVIRKRIGEVGRIDIDHVRNIANVDFLGRRLLVTHILYDEKGRQRNLRADEEALMESEDRALV